VATAFAATILGMCVTDPAAAESAEGRIANANSAAAVPGSYLVMLEPGTPASRIDQLAEAYDGSVTQRYPSIGGFAVSMSADRAEALAGDPGIAAVEADTRVTTSALTQSSPPSWGLDRIDQVSLPLDHSYTQPVSAAGVNVYVIDSGVLGTHQEFGGRVADGWDFIDDDATAQDGTGHGTHVAGTIGGATAGVAKDVKLIAVRVFDNQGNGTLGLDIAGIQWVINHATLPAVINMSIGGTYSALENAAVKAATDAGIVVVVAAGNADKNACTESPASAPEAITVGASDAADERASFSNWGSCVDVFAPGDGIVSSANTGNADYTTKRGTSMAAPHVAGAAALLLAADPTATPAQVQHDLVAAATPGTVTGLKACTTGRLLTVGVPAGPAGTDVPPAANADLGTEGKATAGGRLAVSGIGFAPGATVRYTMYPGAAVLGESTATASGTITESLPIPAGVTCDITVVASGLDGQSTTRVLSARVVLSTPAAVTLPIADIPAPVATLPLTGNRPMGLVAAGTSLVLLGLAAILAANLRRRQA
jgi:subtilisin family serine protease